MPSIFDNVIAGLRAEKEPEYKISPPSFLAPEIVDRELQDFARRKQMGVPVDHLLSGLQNRGWTIEKGPVASDNLIENRPPEAGGPAVPVKKNIFADVIERKRNEPAPTPPIDAFGMAVGPGMMKPSTTVMGHVAAFTDLSKMILQGAVGGLGEAIQLPANLLYSPEQVGETFHKAMAAFPIEWEKWGLLSHEGEQLRHQLLDMPFEQLGQLALLAGEKSFELPQMDPLTGEMVSETSPELAATVKSFIEALPVLGGGIEGARLLRKGAGEVGAELSAIKETAKRGIREIVPEEYLFRDKVGKVWTKEEVGDILRATDESKVDPQLLDAFKKMSREEKLEALRRTGISLETVEPTWLGKLLGAEPKAKPAAPPAPKPEAPPAEPAAPPEPKVSTEESIRKQESGKVYKSQAVAKRKAGIWKESTGIDTEVVPTEGGYRLALPGEVPGEALPPPGQAPPPPAAGPLQVERRAEPRGPRSTLPEDQVPAEEIEDTLAYAQESVEFRRRDLEKARTEEKDIVPSAKLRAAESAYMDALDSVKILSRRKVELAAEKAKGSVEERWKKKAEEAGKKIGAEIEYGGDWGEGRYQFIVKAGEGAAERPSFMLKPGEDLAAKAQKTLDEWRAKQGEAPKPTAPKRVKHFTKAENIEKILEQGFDTNLPPLHGLGGLEKREAYKPEDKVAKDTLYFTADEGRWNKVQVYVGEGKGTEDYSFYDYDSQKWVDEKKSMARIDLSPIEADIKETATILTLDSMDKFLEFQKKHFGTRYTRDIMPDIVAKAKELGFDILNVKRGKGWFLEGKTDKFGEKDLYDELTGRGGNDDYFIFNKDAIDILRPEKAKETVRETREEKVEKEPKIPTAPLKIPGKEAAQEPRRETPEEKAKKAGLKIRKAKAVEREFPIGTKVSVAVEGTAGTDRRADLIHGTVQAIGKVKGDLGFRPDGTESQVGDLWIEKRFKKVTGRGKARKEQTEYIVAPSGILQKGWVEHRISRGPEPPVPKEIRISGKDIPETDVIPRKRTGKQKKAEAAENTVTGYLRKTGRIRLSKEEWQDQKVFEEGLAPYFTTKQKGVKGGTLSWDKAAQQLKEMGLLRGESLDDLVEAIKSEKAAKKAGKAITPSGIDEEVARKGEEYEEKKAEELARFNPQSIRAGDLDIGDVFSIQGEQYRVIGEDQDGYMTIKDGDTLRVDAESLIEIDNGLEGVRRGRTSEELRAKFRKEEMPLDVAFWDKADRETMLDYIEDMGVEGIDTSLPTSELRRILQKQAVTDYNEPAEVKRFRPQAPEGKKGPARKKQFDPSDISVDFELVEYKPRKVMYYVRRQGMLVEGGKFEEADKAKAEKFAQDLRDELGHLDAIRDFESYQKILDNMAKREIYTRDRIRSEYPNMKPIAVDSIVKSLLDDKTAVVEEHDGFIGEYPFIEEFMEAREEAGKMPEGFKMEVPGVSEKVAKAGKEPEAAPVPKEIAKKKPTLDDLRDQKARIEQKQEGLPLKGAGMTLKAQEAPGGEFIPPQIAKEGAKLPGVKEQKYKVGQEVEFMGTFGGDTRWRQGRFIGITEDGLIVRANDRIAFPKDQVLPTSAVRPTTLPTDKVRDKKLKEEATVRAEKRRALTDDQYRVSGIPLDDYLDRIPEGSGVTIEDAKRMHRVAVEKVLEQGGWIEPAVLKDYPDLKNPEVKPFGHGESKLQPHQDPRQWGLERAHGDLWSRRIDKTIEEARAAGKDYVNLMKNAHTAEEGRHILSRAEDEISGLLRKAGLKWLKGQGYDLNPDFGPEKQGVSPWRGLVVEFAGKKLPEGLKPQKYGTSQKLDQVIKKVVPENQQAKIQAVYDDLKDTHRMWDEMRKKGEVWLDPGDGGPTLYGGFPLFDPKVWKETYPSVDKAISEFMERRRLAKGAKRPDLNWFNDIFNTPYYIFVNKHPEGKATFQRAREMFQEREDIAAELSDNLNDYVDLSYQEQEALNKLLAAGRHGRVVFTEDELAEKGMSDRQIAGYRAVRRTMGRALEIFEDAIVYRLTNGKVQHSHGMSLDMLADILDQIYEPPTGDVQQELFGPTKRISDKKVEFLLETIERIREAQRHGYVPFSRFGDYAYGIRRIGEDGKLGEYIHWSTAETAGKAAKGFQKLRERYAKGISEGRLVAIEPEQMLKKEKAALLQAVGPFEVGIVLEMSGLDTGTSEAFKDLIDRLVKAQGFKKHFFEAKDTPGYTMDFERAFADYIIGISGYVARMKGIPEMDELAVQAFHRKPKLAKYYQSWRDYIVSPQEEFHRVRSALFVYYLGLNPKSAAVNFTQTLVNTFPWLTQYVSSPRAMKEIVRAMREIGAAIGETEEGGRGINIELLPRDVQEHIRRGIREGIISDQLVYELMGKAKHPPTLRKVSKYKQRGSYYMGYLFSRVEKMNRLVAMMAALRIHGAVKAKGGYTGRASFEEDPYLFGSRAVDETQFIYSKLNRPRLFRKIGAMVGIFRSFTVMFLENMARLWRVSRKAALASIGMLTAFSGVLGIPFAENVKDLLEQMYGFFSHRKPDIETDMRDWSYEHFGTAMPADLLLHGGWRAATGVDLSRSIGQGDIVPGLGMQGESLMGELIGVPADIAERARRSYSRYMEGNIYRAIEGSAPEFMRNPMVAARWAREGVLTTSGQTVVSKENVSKLDIVKKALGFQPTVVSKAYEREEARDRLRQKLTKVQADLTREVVNAYRKGDMKAAEAAMGKADAWMLSARDGNGDPIIVLTPSGVGKAPEDLVILNENTLSMALAETQMGEKFTGFMRMPTMTRPYFLKLNELYK